MSKKTLVILIFFIVVGAGLVLLITADQPTDEPTDNAPTATSTPATSSAVSVESNTIEESTDTYDISATYPTEGVGVGDVEIYVRGRVAEFQAQAPESAEGEFFRSHELLIEFDRYVRGEITSYVVTEYKYSGGASGMTTVEVFVYGDEDELLLLSDVIPEDQRSDLVTAVEQQLREVNNVAEGEDLSYEITFEDLESFYLTDDQLIIVFSQYEVAPGAAGVVQVELSANQYLDVE